MKNKDTELDYEATRKKFKMKPAQVIVLGFLVVILFGALLLALPISNNNGLWLNYINALFTSTSAVCVTGLAVVPTAPTFTIFGQVMILLLIQIGGLGFMTMSTMIMIMLRRKISFKDRLTIQEALNQNQLKGIVKLVRNIIILTLMIEAVGALILLPVFVYNNGSIGIFQAIFTSVSAFCNAGFDILGTQMNPFIGMTGFVDNTVVSLTLCMLIILGGMGFTVIMDLFRSKFRFKKFSLHTKIVLISTVSLIIFGFIMFLALEYNSESMNGLSGGYKILAAFFQSVTTRTAGFNTIDQQQLTIPSKIVSMFLMFIGASPGSTGGGVKTTTLTIIVLMMIAGMRGTENVVLGKKTINTKNCMKAVSVLVLSFLTVITLSFVLMLTEKGTVFPENWMYTTDALMYESFSAFGTVGLSTGITPYLSNLGKTAIMLTMFLGRLGPVTIGLIFLSKQNFSGIRYPDANIMIG